ncbi:P-type conjugative transfer protein TrbL [Lysobacter auxotrophicus]|uniref:P-type conjugative transfer protein TrbL n=1 Tax=Lysobacter auxotrophicus TaxID=2992573 RepID=A0ABN6UGD7_9GAMM|nr:P-type conjugative transfer protein TrbL [Lysobacter auxotrophicus]BDU15385.1 P-type conjugative transfer protein TrbL [Lysobacter auxotrophicus]
MKPVKHMPPVRAAQGRARMSMLAGGLAVVVLFFSAAAAAQQIAPSMGMFDDIAAFYMQQAKATQAVLEPFAYRLFGLLAFISIAMFFVKQLMNGEGNLTTLVTRFAMEILKLGFFMMVVTHGPQLLLQFIGYFIQGGAAVTGLGELSASGIVVLGFDACFRTFDAIGAMGWGDTAAFGLPLALAGMGILACFAVVGILYLVRVIELYMVMYGGVLLLGFGGISFTRDIPKNYLSYMIGAGTQLFMLNVVIGFGMQLVTSWPASLTLGTTPDAVLRQVLQLFVGSAVFAALAWSIPKVAGSLVNGAVSLGANDALAPAVTAGGAAAMGAAVAAGGGSTIAAATQGAMQAATSGVSLAKESGASGIGAAVKGLGHAVGATALEAGQAAKARLGLAPPSVNATDSRGRNVENIGTRAANNLQGQAQQVRETKADTSVSANASDPGSGPDDGVRRLKGQRSATPNDDGGPEFRQPDTSNPNWGSRIAPPQLPPDPPPASAVSIRLDIDD